MSELVAPEVTVPRARLASLRRVAIVPAHNEEGSIGGRRPGDPGLRRRARDRGDRRRLDRPHRPRRARRRRPCRLAAVQPRDRRRRPDRVPLARGGAASTSSSGSTATGSTSPRSCRSCSGRSSTTAPTSSSARASPARATTGRRSRAGSGSASSPRLVSLLDAAARHRHDLRLPGVQPARDPPVRRRLPARLPRGRGDRDGVQAPAAAREVHVRDARAHGRDVVDRRARVRLLRGQGDARGVRRALAPVRDAARGGGAE